MIMDMLHEKKAKWESMKGKNHDVTHENFIGDVVLTYEWIIGDIEKMLSRLS